jgi:mono/diheme cytochrome c family protein
MTRQSAIGVIAAGRNTMPAFRASYSDQELRDLAAYVAERLAAVNN